MLFLLCDGLCLAAHAALAFVALRERLYLPTIYGAFCSTYCLATVIGIGSEAFRANFATMVVPAFIAGWLIYGLLFLERVTTGCSPQEMLLSAALLCGVGASIAVGFLQHPGYSRLVLQTAVVVLPILIAIGSLHPTAFPEPVLAAPAIMDFPNPMISAPRPMEVTL
jgi:hypothetical protein